MLAEYRGEIPLDEKFKSLIDLCTGCRACEAACPSGVQYGALLEYYRAKIRKKYPPRGVAGVADRVGLHWLMPNRARLRFTVRALRLYQKPALRKPIRALLPRKLKRLEAMAPPIKRVPASDAVPVPVEGTPRAEVNFFTGCVASAALPHVDEATLRVLARAGCKVVVPPSQTCCGAAHAHQGDLEFAKQLARKNIDAFPGDAPIITNAGGCGAMLKEYDKLLADDPEYREKAKAFVKRVTDITQYLAEHGMPEPTREMPITVAIHDSCHLTNVLKAKQAQRRLLKAIPKLVVREPEGNDICCGSGGVYNLLQPDVADELLKYKVECIAKTGATVLATTNPGCYMHLQRGLEEKGIRVAHVVELVEEATRR